MSLCDLATVKLILLPSVRAGKEYSEELILSFKKVLVAISGIRARGWKFVEHAQTRPLWPLNFDRHGSQ